jgi:tyrosinase
MFGLRGLSLILAATSLVIAHPTTPRRQDSGSFIQVTGATGASALRQEVFTLKNDAAAWNIYLLALERFKNMSGSDPMSWYQIAGIHGQPYVAWDSVGPCNNCTLEGYCTHQSTLFPTWHRAYLALFEQAVVSHAIEVANEFSGDDQSMYLDKANNLRIVSHPRVIMQYGCSTAIVTPQPCSHMQLSGCTTRSGRVIEQDTC